MKIIVLTVVFGLSCIVSTQVIAKDRRHVIIPKLGGYKLDTFRSYRMDFDTTSEEVYGFEYERRFSTGLTIGVEHIHFVNDYVDNVNANRDSFKANIVFFKSKYYFRDGAWKPFILVGAGYGTADAGVNGSAIDGAATQFGFGVVYEWERIGIHMEYKKMSGKFDRDSWAPFIGGTDEVDIDGKGLFAGLSIKL